MDTLCFWLLAAFSKLRFPILIVWQALQAFWTIAIYRAWTSTAALFVLYEVLSFDQAKDLLEGVDQTVQLASLRLLPGSRWSGVIIYSSLWLSSLLLALVLSLVARVTGQIQFREEVPGFFDSNRERFVFYFASAVLVCTLFVVHYSYVAVAIFPTTQTIFGFLDISSDFILPWIVLRFLRARRIFYILVYLIIGLLLAYLNLPIAVATGNDGFVALFISRLTPICALMLILACGIERLTIASQTATLALIVIWGALTATVWGSQYFPWLLLAVGAIPVAFVWLAWAASTLASGLLLVHRFRETVRHLDWVFVAILIIGVFSYLPEKLGREWLEVVQPKPAIPYLVADPAIAGTGQRTSAFNGVIGKKLAVHADGGGLRAALFTAEVLALADDLTCGDFGSHVFAASGVSGGSLGIATWATMRQELVLLEKDRFWTPWSECKSKRAAAGIRDGARFEDPTSCPDHRVPFGRPPQFSCPAPDPQQSPLWTLVRDVLLEDHLSTTLASTLSTDFFKPWGTAKRGQALVDSWQAAARKVLARVNDKDGLALDAKTREAFATDLREMSAGLIDPPLFAFTATEVDTGGRVAITNTSSSIQVGVAALNSARFPLISPVGSVFAGGKWSLLVDGGYYDNSGADTLRDILVQANARKFLKDKVTVVRINGNALDENEDNRCKEFYQALVDQGWWGQNMLPVGKGEPIAAADSPPQGYYGWSGISAFIATRTAHSAEAVKTLEQVPDVVERVGPELRLDYYYGFYPNCAKTLVPVPSPPPSPGATQTPLKPPPCMITNLSVCLSVRGIRRPPLSWYLSLAASEPVRLSALKSAKRLIDEANGE